MVGGLCFKGTQNRIGTCMLAAIWGTPMHEVKFRLVHPGLQPRRTKLEMPGWAGHPAPRKDGSHEYAWHCMPFIGVANRNLPVLIRVVEFLAKRLSGGDCCTQAAIQGSYFIYFFRFPERTIELSNKGYTVPLILISSEWPEWSGADYHRGAHHAVPSRRVHRCGFRRGYRLLGLFQNRRASNHCHPCDRDAVAAAVKSKTKRKGFPPLSLDAVNFLAADVRGALSLGDRNESRTRAVLDTPNHPVAPLAPRTPEGYRLPRRADVGCPIMSMLAPRGRHQRSVAGCPCSCSLAGEVTETRSMDCSSVPS
jgi:hypothetical protein